MKKYFFIIICVLTTGTISFPSHAETLLKNDIINLYLFNYNNLWGYMDENEQIVIEPQFRRADNFSEGLAFVVAENGSSGFINKNGKLVISLEENSWPSTSRGFSNGFVAIYEDLTERNIDTFASIFPPGPFFFIDKNGENVFEQIFYWGNPFDRGLAIVILMDGIQIFINTDGKNALDMEFGMLSPFDYVEGHPEKELARVTLLNGNEAFINRAGENPFDMEFVRVGPFQDDVSRVILDNPRRDGLLDREGNLTILENRESPGLPPVPGMSFEEYFRLFWREIFSAMLQIKQSTVINIAP